MSFARRFWPIALILIAAPAAALAQTDEIQVYDASIMDRGKVSVMLHNNFTPKGDRTPAFAGAFASNHSYNAVAEWAYGVTDWFEAGLYMPLFSFTPSGAYFNGYKYRALFVRPHADDHTFFYGVNFEFSFNQSQWDERKHTSEIRPIVGLHLHPVDIIVNPILDNSYLHGVKGLDFAPSVRVAYNLPKDWAVAAEEYADYGELRDILPAGQQFHQLWGVFDKDFKKMSIEAGIGFGLNDASDRVTMKFMISRDLN